MYIPEFDLKSAATYLIDMENCSRTKFCVLRFPPLWIQKILLDLTLKITCEKFNQIPMMQRRLMCPKNSMFGILSFKINPNFRPAIQTSCTHVWGARLINVEKNLIKKGTGW